MKIEINKDFEEKYKNSYKGLTAGEAAAAVLALLVLAGVSAIAWKFWGLPVNISVYIGFPFMIPVALAGFYKYQGTKLPKLILELLYYRKTRILSFEAEEYDKKKKAVFTMKRRCDNGSF